MIDTRLLFALIFPFIRCIYILNTCISILLFPFLKFLYWFHSLIHSTRSLLNTLSALARHCSTFGDITVNKTRFLAAGFIRSNWKLKINKYIFIIHKVTSCSNQHHEGTYGSVSEWRILCWDQGIYFSYIGLVKPLQGGHMPFDAFSFFSSLSRCWWSVSVAVILRHPF